MIYFDKDCEPASDVVIMDILDNDILSSKNSGFQIGDSELQNLRVGFYKIVKIGEEAMKKTNLKVGSFVFADKLASFYHTYPRVAMRYNALIMETNEDKTSYKALGGRCIVQPESDEKQEGGFVIPTSTDLKIGVVKSITPPYDGLDATSNIKVGDRILLTKDEHDELHGFNGDSSLDPTKPIYIYKTNAIICKLNDGK